jgi:hypothetical protein
MRRVKWLLFRGIAFRNMDIAVVVIPKSECLDGFIAEYIGIGIWINFMRS